MIEHGGLQARRQPGNTNVLHAVHFIPVRNDVFEGVTRDDEGLAAKTGFGRTKRKILAKAAGLRTKAWVIQAGKHGKPVHDRGPIGEIVRDVAIEDDIILEEHDVCRGGAQNALQGGQSGFGLANLGRRIGTGVDLNMNRLIGPVRRTEAGKGSLENGVPSGAGDNAHFDPRRLLGVSRRKRFAG